MDQEKRKDRRNGTGAVLVALEAVAMLDKLI
jgi:hypothetical protein